MKDAITGLELSEKEEYMVVNEVQRIVYSIFSKRSQATAWILENQIKYPNVKLSVYPI